MLVRACGFESRPGHPYDMAQIKIRNFLSKDLSRIIEIEKKSFAEPWPDSYLEKLSQKYPNDFVVVEIAEKVVGYALGKLKEDNTGSIKMLAIDPDYRRQGIGKELIDFLVNRLKENGVKEIFLKLRTNNDAANKFYSTLGFEMVKTIEKYFPNGDDAYLMRMKV